MCASSLALRRLAFMAKSNLLNLRTIIFYLVSDLKNISKLNTLGDLIVDALIDEFVKQGHNNTGKFVDSIAYAVKNLGDILSLDIYFAKYGAILDKGVKADRIPFGNTGGGGKSKYIQALSLWVRQRGFVTSQKQALSMAFAIAKKHKKEGMPTKNSYQYSLNGRRTDFFTYTIESIKSLIDETVYEIAGEYLFAIIEDSINNLKTETYARRAA